MESAAAQPALSQEKLLEEVLAESPVRSFWLARRFSALSMALQVALDFLSVMAALAVAYKGYRLLGLGQHVYYPRDLYLLASAAIALGFVLLLNHYELYRPSNSLLHIRETEGILKATCWSTATVSVAGWLLLKFTPSRWILVLAFFFVLVLVITERVVCYALLRRLHLKGYGVDRVLIYGCSEAGVQVFRKLTQSPRAGLVPVAFVDDNPSLRGSRVHESAYTHRKSLPVVGTGQEIEEIVSRLRITRIILADGVSVDAQFQELSHLCTRHGVHLSFVPLQYHLNQHQLDYRNLDGVVLAEAVPIRERTGYRIVKRLMDLMLGGLALLVAGPVMAVIVVVIWLTDGRPAIFRQERMGQSGRTFRMFKFRSMYRNVPAYAPTPKDPADPRITPVGRFLRRTSLDELPQLLNVLRGEMSLVGPRPEMPFIVARYTPAQRERLLAKPGITGLWQISADRAFEIHENIDYDLYYIRNRSLLLDLVILLHTLIFAIRGVGAF